jgi:hypothetical protein
MTQPYVNKGKHVFVNPTVPGEEGGPMHPSMIIPDDERPTINGEPIAEASHEFVVKKGKNAQD